MDWYPDQNNHPNIAMNVPIQNSFTGTLFKIRYSPKAPPKLGARLAIKC